MAVLATATHWDGAYERNGATNVSWFQASPALSLQLIDSIGVDASDVAIDVGGGASTLVDGLLARGLTDLAVLDVSRVALDLSRERLGDAGASVQWIHSDVLTWTPDHAYTLWHDRAVFHFLTEPSDRAHYVDLARSAIALGGHLAIATFADDGPLQCSGLPVARYCAADLAFVFGSSFTVVDARQETHATPSGNTQRFTWLMLRRLSDS